MSRAMVTFQMRDHGMVRPSFGLSQIDLQHARQQLARCKVLFGVDQMIYLEQQAGHVPWVQIDRLDNRGGCFFRVRCLPRLGVQQIDIRIVGLQLDGRLERFGRFLVVVLFQSKFGGRDIDIR